MSLTSRGVRSCGTLPPKKSKRRSNRLAIGSPHVCDLFVSLLPIPIAIYQLESLSWVTNGGRLLIIEGNMQDGAMVLAGMDRATCGEGRLVRGISKPVDGGVRETAFTSTGGGKTWKPWFALMFRPHN